MEIKVIVVNGRPRSGKSTFCEIFKGFQKYVLEVSLVDPAKQVLETVLRQNPNEKTPETRAFLCELKTLMDKYYDASFKFLNKKIYEYKSTLESYGLEDITIYVLVHSREAQDIERLQKYYDAVVVRIDDAGERSISPEEASNYADRETDNTPYDYLIKNSGDVSDFYENVKAFLKEYLEVKE